MDLHAYPISKHIKDLQLTLKEICIALFYGMIICSIHLDDLLNTVLHPIQFNLPDPFKIVVTSPYEFIFIQTKILFISGLMVSCPWILFFLWKFIQPGIYNTEKKTIITISCLSSCFFFTGCLFAYFYILPYSFIYLSASLPPYIEYFYSMSSLVSFVLNTLITFGLIFQIPIIIPLITHFNLISIQKLSENRRYIIIIAFIIAAIITPTSDPIIQTITAVPLILFFEIGLIFSKLFSNTKSIKDLI